MRYATPYSFMFWYKRVTFLWNSRERWWANGPSFVRTLSTSQGRLSEPSGWETSVTASRTLARHLQWLSYTNNARQTSVTPTWTTTRRTNSWTKPYGVLRRLIWSRPSTVFMTSAMDGRIVVRRDVMFVGTSTVWLLKAVNALSATDWHETCYYWGDWGVCWRGCCSERCDGDMANSRKRGGLESDCDVEDRDKDISNVPE